VPQDKRLVATKLCHVGGLRTDYCLTVTSAMKVKPGEISSHTQTINSTGDHPGCGQQLRPGLSLEIIVDGTLLCHFLFCPFAYQSVKTIIISAPCLRLFQCCARLRFGGLGPNYVWSLQQCQINIQIITWQHSTDIWYTVKEVEVRCLASPVVKCERHYQLPIAVPSMKIIVRRRYRLPIGARISWQILH